MEKNYLGKLLLIVSPIAIVGLIIYFVVTSQEKTFQKVELNYNNTVFNFTETKYYDTIILVGLDQLGLNAININVQPLTLEAKLDFQNQGGDLLAHIREFNGTYFLYISENSRDQSIKIIAHELIHLDQYNSQRLIYKNGEVFWNNKKFDLTEILYEQRPWEDDAYSRGTELESKIRSILY